MGDVHHLPDSMQRQWRVYEGLLKDCLATGGCTAAEINYACTQLKPIYLQYSQPKEIPMDPETVLKELNDWVQAQIFGLLQIIVVRDIELFRLKGG